jgi:hypothetical protein
MRIIDQIITMYTMWCPPSYKKSRFTAPISYLGGTTLKDVVHLTGHKDITEKQRRRGLMEYMYDMVGSIAKVPSGKLSHNYGKSRCYSWENINYNN